MAEEDNNLNQKQKSTVYVQGTAHICHKYIRNEGSKIIRPQKKVIEISMKKLHELFLCLITVSGILSGNTVMNKQIK